ERGLLGIALQPDFARTHGVYLYWTQSQSGTVSGDIADVPLLGNRVDRYVWDPTSQTLTFDQNIIMLRSFQADANQPMRGNPDGTAPRDNPFANVTTQQVRQIEQQAGVILTDGQLNQVVANIHKIFSYGRRNGFGLAFDPLTGSLWESENGDDAFDEMDRIT